MVNPAGKDGGLILGVDASNIRAGGGVTHLSQLLAAAEPPAAGFKQVMVWSGAATLAQLPQRSWLCKIHLPMLDKGLPWRVIWQQLLLPAALEENHCAALFSPGGTAPARLSVPSIVMSQNMLPFEPHEAARYGLLSGTRWRLRLLRRAQSRSMRRADGLIFLTRYAQQKMLQILGCDTYRTAVIPHGIEERFFSQPKASLSKQDFSPARPFRLLYVSIVDMYKHQWQVARAVGELRRKGLPVIADFIGPAYPPALQRLQAAIKAVDPQGAFLRYTGPMAFTALHKAYQNADAFVFASSCENLPNIVLEAMAAGLPIACSNRGPMPEVLGDGGVYFDPEQPAEIAQAIERLYAEPTLRASLVEKAQERVRAHTWPRCAHETLTFIASVIRKECGC